MNRNSFPINECFLSVQGEGVNAGRLAVFLRFGKCNLHCTFCDTPGAIRKYQYVNLSRIKVLARKFRPITRFLVLTGGEPMLNDLSGILKAVKRYGYSIAMETNGTIYREWLSQVDWLTVSPKPGSRISRNVLESASELKFVITGRSDLRFAEQFMPFSPAYLMPANNDRRTAGLILEYLKKSRHSAHFKLGVQLEKVFRVK